MPSPGRPPLQLRAYGLGLATGWIGCFWVEGRTWLLAWDQAIQRVRELLNKIVVALTWTIGSRAATTVDKSRQHEVLAIGNADMLVNIAQLAITIWFALVQVRTHGMALAAFDCVLPFGVC